ncbi:MAG: DivIVA domain-containing protein [Oscillospiraceae bacterium]|nr:DivIVA domain-containing protein [Oscillospiraceae bacterium]
MEAADILDKKFDKGFNGYKMEEVDEFLQEVSSAFLELKKQNEEMEKKMEVLADKIREYRNDEEAIKEALLGAQKQSSAVLTSTKEKSDQMINEAKEKSETMIKEAEERVKEKDEYAKKLVEDANAEKTRVIAECERRSAEIKAKMEAEIKKQESILAKTRDESNSYREKLLGLYNEHIALINSIPEKCENAFVRKAKDTLDITEEEQPVEVKSEEKFEVADPDEEVKKNEEITLEKTNEIALKPAFEKENDSAASEEADASEGEETAETVLFDKLQNKSKFEKLKFGSNNKGKE